MKRIERSVKEELMDFEKFVLEVRRFLAEKTDHDPTDEVDLEFKYYELSSEEKNRLTDLLCKKLKSIGEIVFAYLHGGFVERSFFRDIDVAIWIENPEKAFDYTVHLSAKLEAELRYPIDIHVLNGAPLPYKYHVFTRGKLLFSRDEKLRATIVDKNIMEYMDFKSKYKFDSER